MTPDTPAAPAGARNATLTDLAALLRDQQARKVDIVAPAKAITARAGQLVVDETAPELGPDGVTMTSGAYTPTDVCDQGIADKLGIPAAYLRRMRGQKPDLYDANVNGWLDGDDRKFLLRCLRPVTGCGGGAARAFLSDGYKIIDLSRSWDYPDGLAGVVVFALVKQAGGRALIFGSRDNPAAACDPLPPEQWHPVTGGTMGGTVSWTQGDGPLVPFVDGFRRELAGLGHPPGVVCLHVRLMGQVDRWLSAARLGAGDLSLAVARQFLADRRVRGPRRVPTLAGLAPLLGYLRGEGVLPPEPPAAVTGTDVLLARYRGYLAGDRGLAPTTIGRYERFARRFLAGRASRAGGGTGAEGLASSEINNYLLGAASRLTTVDSVKREAADLRSLLRFLYLTGVVETDLGAAMPPAAGWRGTRLPSALGRAEVEALLGSCDRSTPGGRRDRAILALLARLGLRCGEVAALQFADIDWRAGDIVVCGKRRRRDRLPLPAEVGEALAAYLAGGRPACPCRQVFVTVNAPHRALQPGSVTAVVYRACDRAGLGRAGGHRLRHALATEMLRQGGALMEIAQVLRHSDLAATAGYAKVDRAALRMVASPWPGAGR